MKTATSTAAHIPNRLIVCVQSPVHAPKDFASYTEEFRNLVHSSGRLYQHEKLVPLRSLDVANFFTKGKLEELSALVAKEKIEEVIISEPLSPAQQRNLEDLFQCAVVDRTLLILEIFEAGATSAEGKKQVALARFQYEKARLSGRGIHMSQQSGRVGGRGPGETAKEKETQHLERQMLKLKKDLRELALVRTTQRKKRVGGQLPLLCLIGYTNAGKSTILNALTKSGVIAENRLFSTLDTTTREFYIGHKKVALISDTVGFIQQLPHHLIEAFKSTLSELSHADLLLHVVDFSDTNWRDHIAVVHDVLQELGIADIPMLYIFNKTDRLEITDTLERALASYQPRVLISAITPEGLEPLREYLHDFVKQKPV